MVESRFLRSLIGQTAPTQGEAPDLKAMLGSASGGRKGYSDPQEVSIKPPAAQVFEEREGILKELGCLLSFEHTRRNQL